MTPSVTTAWLYWAAAFIDGEGYFDPQRGSPKIVVAQNAPELLERLRAMFGGSIHQRGGGRVNRRWVLCGPAAAGVAMTLYPILSRKRRAEVVRFLAEWRRIPVRRGLTPWDRITLQGDDFLASLGGLGERDTAIITRYRHGERGASIGAHYRITKERVYQIVKKALARYRRSIAI